MHLRHLVLALGTIAATVAFSTAQANPINGAITFTDGLTPGSYGTTTDIVSQMTRVDDDALTVETASSCLGVFTCVPQTANIAHDFNVVNGDQVLYTYNGFTFHMTNTGTVQRMPLTCSNGGCSDQLNLVNASGYVTGNGFDPTIITFIFQASGHCNQATPGVDLCGSNVTAGWHVDITATGQPFQLVPEPASMALVGVGLLGLALARRRRG